MKPASLKDLCCPVCGGTLSFKEVTSEDDGIVEGLLGCTDCCALYPIYQGIPHLLSSDEMGHTKAQEMQGWVNMWRKKGMYDHPSLEDSFRLPYLGGVWALVAPMYELALEEMDLQGDEVILDLGAGQGWASRHFAERGCKVFAVDIVADSWYGLGRSWALMQHADVYFEPVLADGEALPFFSDSFDIVFLCGTLHHFEKFSGVLEQIYASLRPGGRLIVTGEPSVPMLLREHDVQKSLEEVQEGITERRPKVLQYWWAIRRVGFKDIRIDTLETYNASPSEIREWIVSIRYRLYHAVKSRYRPLVWLVLSGILVLPHKWAKELVLHMYGGNLLLRATKPADR